jgi:thiamine transporter ThiT
MCFSAGASFTAGAVICAVGIATVKEVQKPSQWIFASIPLIYLFVTITSLFISSTKNMHLLGILMFLSCVVSVILYTKNTTSVWCFFAAVISGVIYWIIRVPQEENSPVRLRLMKIISDNNPWKRRSN